jgi:outer membrane protein assembly factor BamD (BamD/ComL family)
MIAKKTFYSGNTHFILLYVMIMTQFLPVCTLECKTIEDKAPRAPKKVTSKIAVSLLDTFLEELPKTLCDNDLLPKSLTQPIFNLKKDDTRSSHQSTRNRYKKQTKSTESKKNPIATIRDPQKDRLLKKTLRDMSLEELREAHEYAILIKNTDSAIKFIEHMIMATKDQKELCSLRLELSDLYFEKGDMKNAGKHYLEYVKFYPGSKQCDYAEYKAILSRFYARLKPPLDQTKTRRTIRLAQNYIDRPNDQNKIFQDDVKRIQHMCYQDLYSYEVDIFNGYLKRGQLTGAQTHLGFIKEELLPVMKEIEPQMIECEIVLAQKQGNKTLAGEKTQHLEQTFPTYVPLKLAAQTKKKKSYVSRF